MKINNKVGLLLCAVGMMFSSATMACAGDFYIAVMDADASPNIRVRSSVIDSTGTSDLLGNVTMPDSALGGINTLYMFDLISQAYVNNTKLRITTDDTDCVISSADENLGTITDVQSSDF